MTRRLLFTAALLLLLTPLLIFAQSQPTSVPPAILSFTGTITEMSHPTFTVNGRTVDISNATVNSPILVPGLSVHIRAYEAPDFTLIAEQVDYVPGGFIPGLVEISGTISEITETTIRVGNEIIDTTNARILDLLQVGQQVEVFAYAAFANNSLVWQARIVSLAENLPSPVETPEVVVPVAPVVAPVFTPEVSFDDHGGGSGNDGDDDRNDDHGGNSGHGGGDDHGGDDD